MPVTRAIEASTRVKTVDALGVAYRTTVGYA